MREVPFQIDYSDIEILEEKIRSLPKYAEQVINNYLHQKGVSKTTDNITKHMPISKKHKIHAKHTNWSRKETENLGFVVKAKGGAANRPGSFGYLVFPNEGRGPRNPVEQRFFEQGLHETTPAILEDLLEEITIKTQEVLG